MRRLAAVLAVLGVCAVPAVAFAVDNNPPWDHPDASWSTRIIGHEQHSEFGRTMQCDVYQDYYYNDETGEFLGWASEPYETNCIEVSTPGNCKPGVLPCCPAGENCPPEEPDPIPPHDNPPPPTPPRKTCAQCKEQSDARMSHLSDQIKGCSVNWGYGAARAMCKRGLVRGHGGYDPNLDWFINEIMHGRTDVCFDSPVGRTCTEIPEFTHCVDDYMFGKHPETVTEGHTGGAETEIKIADAWTVGGSFEYSNSHEVQLPAGEGYAQYCVKAFAPQIDAARTQYNQCQRNSRDGTGPNGRKACPVTTGATPPTQRH
jgi:hypothetical protein